MTTSSQEKLMATPDIPKEFGDDGGNFYKYYDELAEEIDEDLVKSLKAQLDGILIFAGLFAGVNSAFLALTLPQMSANPADDTNALLLQIALGVNNSITSVADLPSASFKPPAGIYPINVLFSVSLALALFSSFLAVLGQQWIVYYRKRGGGGPEYQRWEQLRRYLGAKRWQLEMVLDDLVPILLQLGLLIFCIAFALYLDTLSHSLNRIIVSLLCIAVATVLALSTCVAFDPWCPFKLPLSRIVRPVGCAIPAVVKWLGVCGVATVVFIAQSIFAVMQRAIMFCRPSNSGAEKRWKEIWSGELDEFAEAYTTGPANTYREFSKVALRSPDNPDDLKIKALRRVMCTSEDRRALIYSALNLQAIRDQKALSTLARDAEFRTRLANLYQAALDDTRRGRTGSHGSFMEARVFSASFSHLLIITSSVPFLSWARSGKNPSQITHLDNLAISPSQICDLSQGNSIPSTGSCYQCSHCASLRFCMSVVHLLAEGFNDSIPTNFDVAFKGTVGVLTTSEDLRLGCVVASVVLSSKKWRDVGPPGFADWPRSELLEKLFEAYRTKSKLEMFHTISEALTTVSGEWRRKPDHEIYVRLFELCLLPEIEETSNDDRHAVLECFGAHLLSIESRIRDKNASEMDRQNGRDLQNRCVQSVANFFRANSGKWTFLGPSLEQYLNSATKLIEADPWHSENPGMVAVLRRMKSSFLELTIGETMLFATRPWDVYSKFRQLVDHVESMWARKVNQDLGLRYQRLSCIQQRGEMWCNQQEPEMHMLAL